MGARVLVNGRQESRRQEAWERTLERKTRGKGEWKWLSVSEDDVSTTDAKLEPSLDENSRTSLNGLPVA